MQVFKNKADETFIAPQREFKVNHGLEEEQKSFSPRTQKQKVILYTMRMQWKSIHGRKRRRWIKTEQEEIYIDVN